MGLGARGVVLKQSARDLLVKSIHRVHAGEIWLDNRMTAEVMKAFSKSSEAGPRREKPLLSDREKEIVQLVAQGFRNKEIGEKLFISEQTVKNHLHNIFDKLVSDRWNWRHAIHHRNRSLSLLFSIFHKKPSATSRLIAVARARVVLCSIACLPIATYPRESFIACFAVGDCEALNNLWRDSIRKLGFAGGMVCLASCRVHNWRRNRVEMSMSFAPIVRCALRILFISFSFFCGATLFLGSCLTVNPISQKNVIEVTGRIA
jgi:DNA-binding CsgD family transcriptional regulator